MNIGNDRAACEDQVAYTNFSELDARGLKLVRSWEKRAQVKQPITYALEFIPSRPDFPTELLPFKYSDWEGKHGTEAMTKVLTYAWVGFNHKIINIESNVLVPSCKLLMDRAYARNDGLEVELVAQAQTDEAFHVLMTHKVNCISLARRGLQQPNIPRPRIVHEIESIKENAPEQWKHELGIIAASIVTEVLIKGFLSPISRSETIQPLHRVVTNMHLIDEAAHGQVFRVVAHKLLLRLEGEQREFFIAQLKRSVNYFSDVDVGIWVSLIEQAGLEVASHMVEEIASHQTSGDQSQLDKFFEEHERMSRRC